MKYMYKISLADGTWFNEESTLNFESYLRNLFKHKVLKVDNKSCICVQSIVRVEEIN